MADTIQRCAVLFMDIADSTALRRDLGDAEASRRIGSLLDALVALVRSHHGEVLKSDGDDLLVVFNRDPEGTGDAADAAIAAQRTARDANLALYVGLHTGPVEFRMVQGRPDVLGMTVHFAARLHKLVPGVPGYIFLATETARTLPVPLQERTYPYGNRHIKGIGATDVVTLDWSDNVTVIATDFSRPPARPAAPLVLRHGDDSRRLLPADAPLVVGRARDQCKIVVEDPRVSSRHLQVLYQNGCWYARDASRNGTWLRNAATGEELLLQGGEAVLPRAGALCLGRPFAKDPEGRFTLHFQTADA